MPAGSLVSYLKAIAYSCVNRVLMCYILLNGVLTSIWEHAVQKLMSFSSGCTTTKHSISSFCFCRAKYSIFGNERWSRSHVMHRLLPLVTKPRLHNIHIRSVVQLTGYIGQRPYASSRTAKDVLCNTTKRKKNLSTLVRKTLQDTVCIWTSLKTRECTKWPQWLN